MKRKANYTIKELPSDERPREKLYEKGPKELSNTELLAIIIRTGNRKESAIDLSRRVLGLDKDSLQFLKDSTLEELTKLQGIGKCKAAQILAAVELGKRISSIDIIKPKKISSPKDISDFMMEEMKDYKKEFFRTIMLDTKNNVICYEDISVGSLNSSIVHPREVFNRAIRRSSASIILVHNHPSGDPKPSMEDINITRRLIEAGQIIGIRVLDHIIVGNKKYVSLKEEDII
ncbi:DNA repair protein RadC [Clostridium sp. D2Q-14]|uniref:RadC family protein n=1 Tax=Anaeromonas gelatinilytica TaxID=2683194 RepID=UPI00193AFCCD|nr:DNA repair protein RadC [Anaeromonas gelatinilytica]MBS4535873.1 DNA repair protein RadC [Anaeromonas gelatinilytica]